MKKTLCLLLAMVLITALFAGCAPAVPETSGTTAPTTAPTDPEPTDPIPTDPEPTNPTEPSQGTEPAEPNDQPNDQPSEQPSDQPKEFEVQILHAGGPRDEEVCAIALRSTAELHAYCQQYAQDLEKYFHEEIAVYDDAFFADHTLIVLAIHEGTCSNRHEVTQVIAQADGNYVVYIDRTIPADQSDAEAFWHILIAVEGCCAEDAQVTVEENNIFLPLQW